MATAGEASAWTFRGGILLASLATTALVLVVVERPGRLQAVLELPAARWIGARSYGIYLWHWPVFLVIGADLPVAPGSPAYLATRVWCVVMTLVIADLSYRFIETPVRRHGFRGTAGRALARLRAMGTRGARVLWGLALVLALVVTVVLVTAPERTPPRSSSRPTRPPSLSRTRRHPRLGRRRPANPGTATADAATTSPSPASAAVADSTTADWTMPSGKEIDVFGDSMAVGSIPPCALLARHPRRRQVQPPVERRAQVRRRQR